MKQDGYDSRFDTLDHIQEVRKLLTHFSREILDRSAKHDASKFREPEKSLFDEFTLKLKNCTYGSEEYKDFLSEMGVALDHHYKNNRHHPEHFAGGINDMNLLDIVEMLFDWMAATKRHDDGDILKSIEINAGRFGIDDQLKQILLNTVEVMAEAKVEG